MHAVGSQWLVLKDDSLEPESVLQFHLTYEGPLHGSFNGNKRAEEKHAIRKILHGQLRHLWDVTPQLNNMLQPPIQMFAVNGETGNVRRREYLSKNFARLNGHFVPLITADIAVWCGIEVLFLRTGRAGRLFERGDIDNRMKTLLDALKMPTQMEELGGHSFPTEDEKPFFCLLEDDGLVSKFSAETGTLLQPLGGGVPQESDARVILTVEIRPLTSAFGFM